MNFTGNTISAALKIRKVQELANEYNGRPVQSAHANP
jgi:hypothetical protein